MRQPEEGDDEEVEKEEEEVEREGKEQEVKEGEVDDEELVAGLGVGAVSWVGEAVMTAAV